MVFYKNIAAKIVSSVIIIIAVLIFIANISDSDTTSAVGNLYSDHVRNEIKILRNKFDIPHAIAVSAEDACFAMGLVHAKDRLWQMDIFRRRAAGRMAEIFGQKKLDSDHFISCFDLDQSAANIYADMPDSAKKLLDAYTAGVNYVINEMYEYYSFEFSYLDYKPEPWSSTDCIMIQRFHALKSSSSITNDLILGAIAEKVGLSAAADYIPDYPEYSPCIFDDKAKPDIDRTKFRKQLFTDSSEALIPKQISQITEQLLYYTQQAGFSCTSNGSNCWLIKKSDKKESGVVLANDPHSKLSLASEWYQMHLTCDEFNIVGLTLPGMPGFFVGRNDKLVWGFADLKLDDFDYFVNEIDTEDSDSYIESDGSNRKFVFIKDTIKIKGEPDFVFYKKYTERSAVISGLKINPSLNGGTQNESINADENYCVSYRWTGVQTSDEISALINAGRSKTSDEFIHALENWKVPAMNFVYADENSDISIYPAGNKPQRGAKNLMMFPNPGFAVDYDWEENNYSHISEKPMTNPSKHYIIASNNKLFRESDEIFSHYAEFGSGAERINDLLSEFVNLADDYTAYDARRMQNDVMSPYAVKI